MYRAEPDETPACEGAAHAWQLEPYVSGQPPRAVAQCCGARLVFVAGAWEMVGDQLIGARPCATAPA